jgi:hypothetical protein
MKKVLFIVLLTFVLSCNENRKLQDFETMECHIGMKIDSTMYHSVTLEGVKFMLTTNFKKTTTGNKMNIISLSCQEEVISKQINSFVEAINFKYDVDLRISKNYIDQINMIVYSINTEKPLQINIVDLEN